METAQRPRTRKLAEGSVRDTDHRVGFPGKRLCGTRYLSIGGTGHQSVRARRPVGLASTRGLRLWAHLSVLEFAHFLVVAIMDVHSCSRVPPCVSLVPA